jgi:hypothetical protein
MARSDWTAYDSRGLGETPGLTPRSHWSLRRTFGFVFCSSALLWSALAIGLAASIAVWRIDQFIQP